MFEDTIGVLMYRDDYGTHNTTVYKHGQEEEFISKLKYLYKACADMQTDFGRNYQYVIGPAGSTKLALEANHATGGPNMLENWG